LNAVEIEEAVSKLVEEPFDRGRVLVRILGGVWQQDGYASEAAQRRQDLDK
jgi:hypothetical protein